MAESAHTLILIMKQCTKCMLRKPNDQFGKARRNPQKLQNVCKACTILRQRDWERKNIEKNLKGIDLSRPQVCRTCKEEKPTSNFYRRANTKSGLDSECAECTKERDKRRYKRDRHKRKYQNKWATIKMKFGITESNWMEMLKKQNSCCAVCRVLFEPIEKAHIDHDHKTGKIRGLLCKKCNFAIGLLNDDPSVFIRAAKYLHCNGRK